VHLELHTYDLSGASGFYRQLLRWRTERIGARSGSYHALTLDGLADSPSGALPEGFAQRALEDLAGARLR
jgi:predicted enzyme related to lactoylglutathione lyase